MTKQAIFSVGVLCGVVAMQIGHALYLRNSDYLFAMFFTAIFGVLVIMGVEDIFE